MINEKEISDCLKSLFLCTGAHKEISSRAACAPRGEWEK